MQRLPVLTLLFFTSLTLHAQQRWYTQSTIDLGNPKLGQQALVLAEYQPPGCLHPPAAVDNEQDYMANLRSMISLFERYPECYFMIEFHTECRGDSVYNRELSQRKADTLQAHLRQRTAARNFSCTGKGETEPVNDCRCEGNRMARKCAEEEHAKNVRTVLKVVK